MHHQVQKLARSVWNLRVDFLAFSDTVMLPNL